MLILEITGGLFPALPLELLRPYLLNVVLTIGISILLI